MSESPDARWTSPEDLPTSVEPRTPGIRQSGPATPQQRRLGNRLALGIMVAVLLVIIVLDHYGILH